MVTEPMRESRPPGWLSVSSFSAGPCLIVVLSGDADCVTAPRLRQELTAALAYGPRSMVLDLTDVEFCNLDGLRALLGAVETAQAAGVDVAMRGMSRQLSRLHRAYGAHRRSVGQLAQLPDSTSVSRCPPAAVRSTTPV